MSAKRSLAVSDNTNTRLLALVENSRPNPTRPRLSEERELRLADVEARSAACYASIEELTYKIHRLVKDIEKGPPSHDGEQRQEVRDGK
jgi:hypothetical protein